MWLVLLLASAPADLAPGAPQLIEAEARLRELLDTAGAVRAATSAMQVEWTRRSPQPAELPAVKKPARGPPDPCADVERIEVGWRIERFGAAWREVAQAARAQAARLDTIRHAPTVAPLVDDWWSDTLDGLVAAARAEAAGVLEAGAWQSMFVRPVLAACTIPPLRAAPGAGQAGNERVAVLGMGDGWVCPDRLRGEDAVVLVDGAACWTAGATCACAPERVLPGAVLGPPPPPGEPSVDEGTSAAE